MVDLKLILHIMETFRKFRGPQDVKGEQQGHNLKLILDSGVNVKEQKNEV